MARIKIEDLPDDIRRQIKASNPEPGTEGSFQMYAADLARVFGVDEIADMFVTTIENKQVLRVRYYNHPEQEYKTIKAPEKKRLPAKRDNYKPKAKTLRTDRDVPDPDTGFGSKALNVGGKIGKGFVQWIRTPPQKRPDQW